MLMNGRLTDADRDAYNATVARQVDDFRDFINLHYVTERDDTPFWRHVRDECIGAPTRERLALWRARCPTAPTSSRCRAASPTPRSSCTTRCSTASASSTARSPRARMAEAPALRAKARETVDSLTSEYTAAARQALPHRAFLESLQRA